MRNRCLPRDLIAMLGGLVAGYALSVMAGCRCVTSSEYATGEEELERYSVKRRSSNRCSTVEEARSPIERAKIQTPAYFAFLGISTGGTLVVLLTKLQTA